MKLEKLTPEQEARLIDAGELGDHLELALSFAPKGPVPEGLFPTSYHTLSYADEVKLQERVDAAREALAKFQAVKEAK